MRDKILIADAGEFNRILLKNALKDEYTIIEAVSGEETISKADEFKDEIAAVLMDIAMPDITGEDVLRNFQSKQYDGMFPIVAVINEQVMERIEGCFDLGMVAYVKRPFKPNLVRKTINKMIEVYSRKNEFSEKLSKSAVTMNAQFSVMKTQAEAIRKSNDTILEAVGSIAEYRNMESSNHIQNVKKYTEILADKVMKMYKEYELDPEKVRIIVSASALHDIGKIAIPDQVLLKPAKLTKEEYELMCSHTLRGYDIIDKIRGAWDESYAKYCKEIARSHHERYDGKGYPEGLKEEEIPVSAQIVSIVDCFDALLSDRVYKAAYTFDEGYNMILNGECGSFSPKLMECFRLSKAEMLEFYNASHNVTNPENAEKK